MACQPFPLTLYPPAASVSLLLLIICAYTTEFRSFITRYWLPVGSSFVVLGFFVIFLDSTWWYVPFFHNSSTSVLVDSSCFVHYSFILTLEISRRAWMVANILNPYCTFSSNFSTTVMTLFRDASVIAYACAFTNPFTRGFRPYIKACMASSVTKSGNATTTLSN